MTTGSEVDLGVVVLSQGKDVERLGRALASVLGQRDVRTDVVVVGNGWVPVGLPSGVRSVALPANVGIPAGRNAGIDAVSGDVLVFVDDDVELPDARLLADVAGRFQVHPRLGMLQPRVLDPEGRPAPRRWVPRMDKSDPARPGTAFSVWEGMVAVRREVLEGAGRWPQCFFYAHEGIELAWRVWDQGRVVWYAGDLVVHHPARDQAARHPYHYRYNARNRVWLARRNLPVPLQVPYVLTWTVVQVVRTHRHRAALRAWFGGWWEGWRVAPPAMTRMSWRTVLRMARWGRLPVV